MICVGHWQEFRADRTAASCHRSYAQGGIELMKTHIVLDSLLRYTLYAFSLFAQFHCPHDTVTPLMLHQTRTCADVDRHPAGIR